MKRRDVMEKLGATWSRYELECAAGEVESHSLGLKQCIPYTGPTKDIGISLPKEQ